VSTMILTNPDVDGVLAASILRAGMRAKWVADSVQFASYQNLESKLRDVLRAIDVDELYLTDLGIEEISPATLDQLVARTRVHLVDHHSLSARRRQQIEQSGGTCWRPESAAQTCSTELALRVIAPSTNRLTLLAAAARVDDFNDPLASEAAQGFARELGAALMPGSDLPIGIIVERLIAEIREASLPGPEPIVPPSHKLQHWLRAAADKVEKMQRHARNALRIQSFQIRSEHFGGLSVACARVPDILLGKIGVEVILAKRPEADIAAALFDDGACWAFPRGFPHGSIDLLPFLESLNGGGRDGGGGFGFDCPTNGLNYRARIGAFITALETYGNRSEFETARQIILGSTGMSSSKPSS
jgi:hypothetical protein